MTFEYFVGAPAGAPVSPSAPAAPAPRPRRTPRVPQSCHVRVLVTLTVPIDRRKDASKYDAAARHYPEIFDNPNAAVEATLIDGEVHTDPFGLFSRPLLRLVDDRGEHNKAACR